jgi:hypothetical protein
MLKGMGQVRPACIVAIYGYGGQRQRPRQQGRRLPGARQQPPEIRSGQTMTLNGWASAWTDSAMACNWDGVTTAPGSNRKPVMVVPAISVTARADRSIDVRKKTGRSPGLCITITSRRPSGKTIAGPVCVT